MSCISNACRPILPAPNGTFWALGVTDTGLFTTTQVFPFPTNYIKAPVLGNLSVAWRLSATNQGLLTTQQVNPPLGRIPQSYILLISSSGKTWLCTIDSNGFLRSTSGTGQIFDSVPYPIDVTMSVYGDTCSGFVVCPTCGSSRVTVSGDLSCWCCTCSSFVLPEDTTITVVLDE